MRPLAVFETVRGEGPTPETVTTCIMYSRSLHALHRDKRNLRDLQEIVLDEGRRPKALLQGDAKDYLDYLQRARADSLPGSTLYTAVTDASQITFTWGTACEVATRPSIMRGVAL